MPVFNAQLRQYGGIIALIALCVVFSSSSPHSSIVHNFMNILRQVAVFALGTTWVILPGDIPAVWLTLLAGLLMGAVIGLLRARLLLPSFMVTVAMMDIFRGCASLPGKGARRWPGVPLIVRILPFPFVANHLLLSFTVFGRQTCLTGGNRVASHFNTRGCTDIAALAELNTIQGATS